MKRKSRIKRRAKKSIDRLFKEAEKVFDERPELAHRYVRIARRVSMRCRVQIPKKWRRMYCKNCHKFLKPGENLRIRFRNKKKVMTCLECGHIRRIPYKS